MYKVIKYFTDLQDNNYAYNVGDTFPHEGLIVTEARLKELSGSRNKQGVPLIEEVEPQEVELQEAEPQEEKKPATRKRTKKTAE